MAFGTCPCGQPSAPCAAHRPGDGLAHGGEDLDAAPVGVEPDHRLRDLRADAWTQLGYTYDWDADADSEVGLSEFVIRAGTEIVIDGVVHQNDYCKQ